jgi:hypothetical protein
MTKKFKVQKMVAFKGRTASGQVNKNVGIVWETIGSYSNRATAERTLKHAQIDNPNSQIRLEEQS